MKIKDRLEKLAEDGYITPEAIEKAQEKGWITAKQKTSMSKKAEDKIIKRLSDEGKMGKVESVKK